MTVRSAGDAFREVDKGWKALRATVALIKQHGSHVKVGVLDGVKGGSDERGELTNAELAAVMEFGTADGHIPARPFVGSTIDANREVYHAFMGTLLARVYEGKLDVRNMLEVLGAKAANDVKRAVTSGEGIPPPNAPSTIAAKGSSRPLVDTGRLVGAVSWLVVLFGGKGASDAE